MKQRLEKADYEVYAAATWPNAVPGGDPDAIDSESGRWVDSAKRLDHQLTQAGYSGRPVILVGHSMGGLIARVYAKIWSGLASGCEPLGIVQLGTPNKGSKAAALRAVFPDLGCHTPTRKRDQHARPSTPTTRTLTGCRSTASPGPTFRSLPLRTR